MTSRLPYGEDTVTVIPIESREMSSNPMRLRHAVQSGDEVGLTFRGALYAAVVPWEQHQAERAERAELRQRVAELEMQLHEEEAA